MLQILGEPIVAFSARLRTKRLEETEEKSNASRGIQAVLLVIQQIKKPYGRQIYTSYTIPGWVLCICDRMSDENEGSIVV